jgi:chromosome segregation ATPase
MKSAVAGAVVVSVVSANEASPIAKVIQMVSDLETKIIGEGEECQKTYEEFSEWCEETAKNVKFEIKTGKNEVAGLKATIEKDTANIQTQDSTIEELAASIATDEADLKAATEIRDKEEADFSAQEKDLVETIDIVERAVGIIEKEMNGGAAMVQLKQATNVVEALRAMVDAQSLSSADSKKLTALVQSSSDDDSEGAPDPAAYENQSGGVVGVLNDLLEKAQGELDAARQKEQADLANFQMLHQSLTDEVKFANKEMDESKKSKSESEESKAMATGDLDVTTKDLNNDVTELDDLHHNCMTKANDFEAETKSRAEELKALATAKKIIIEATSLAQTSFLQRSKISTRADLVNYEAVRYVHDLARKQHSSVLSQLASRLSSTVKFSTGSQADIFAKIKGLITDMVEKLEAEAEGDATEKAYCDKELGETNMKKDDKTAEIEKLTAKIDSMTSESKQLKGEIATLQKELGELTSSQAEMDKLRAEEKALFEANSAETEKGLNGVKLALKVLNEYYSKADKAHSSSDGASSGIIGLLEVCESDFSKALTEMTAAEETSQNQYDAQTKENEITKATKDQDVKYKTKDSAGLDKSVAEYSSDRSGVESELSAVKEYLKQLEGRCIAKAETYGERKARREAEIQGLKEALTVLENETAFIQKSTRSLRVRRQ